jgi:hypothetical protein
MKSLIIQLKRFAQRPVSHTAMVAMMLAGLVAPGNFQPTRLARRIQRALWLMSG